MRYSALALVAAIGLGLSACNQAGTAPAKSQDQTQMTDKPAASPAPAAADDGFTNAANFECEVGGKVDLVFNYDSPPSVTARIDGGASLKLPVDFNDTSGMLYRDATTSVRLEGAGLGLTVNGQTKTCAFKPRDLMPPKADGVVRTLTKDDAGASVEIKVGEKVAIALVGVPTAGYAWDADDAPAFVKPSQGPSGATSTSQMLPGFTGGNHWEVTLIEGISAGSGEITLAERRPWEKKSLPAAETFKFKLTVK
ncbi:MAG TPA: protease inhibitor I42 family protein [Hyphomonadaceae bacterium]|nr:protease inhibitor I42 family protein [Hyphomonadaceae bacterium]